jgi:hypothetical protein
MGATGWTHFTPYEKNIEKALQTLRTKIFIKGDYGGPTQPSACSDSNSPLFTPELQQTLKKALSMSELMDDIMLKRGAENCQTEHDVQEIINLLEQADDNNLKTAIKNAEQDLSPPLKTCNIDELIELSAEAGTHSILDIAHVAAEPDFGVSAPLNNDELIQLFGTLKPTKSLIDKNNQKGELINLRERWQGTYIIVYENNQPSEILFTGSSGD